MTLLHSTYIASTTFNEGASGAPASRFLCITNGFPLELAAIGSHVHCCGATEDFSEVNIHDATRLASLKEQQGG